MLRSGMHGQSLIEYTLLVAVAILGLLAIGYLSKFSSGAFENHFNKSSRSIRIGNWN